MVRLLFRLYAALPVLVISGLLGVMALSMCEVALVHIGWVKFTWFNQATPQWNVAVLYFGLGGAIGATVCLKQLPAWKAAACGALLCYFTMGALITMMGIVSGRLSWSAWEAVVPFLLVGIGLNIVAGVVIGLVAWTVCRVLVASGWRHQSGLTPRPQETL